MPQEQPKLLLRLRSPGLPEGDAQDRGRPDADAAKPASTSGVRRARLLHKLCCVSSTKDVARALEANIEVVGRVLLDVSEDQWYDRKSIRIKAPALAQHLVGFANADGGTIVV